MKKAFTLMEVLLVVALIAIISAIGAVNLGNYGRGTEIDSFAKKVVFDLRAAKAKAMAGENNMKWGVRFSGDQAGQYYEIYSTPTTFSDPSVSTTSRDYLPQGISADLLAPFFMKDFLFSRAFGTTTPQTVTLSSQQKSVVVTVTAQGAIY